MSFIKLVVLICVVIGAASESAADSSITQIAAKVVRQFINSQPADLLIGDGVHLVNTRNDNDARSAGGDDRTVLGALETYLHNHELRIRLPELMPGEGFGRSFKETLEELDDKDAGNNLLSHRA